MSTTNKFDPDKLDFSACIPACQLSDFSPALVASLRLAQRFANFNFSFSSGFRPKSWELSHGRNGSSSHSKTPCLAVDIHCKDSHCRFKIVASLLSAGFDRIGIGKNFVHADIDYTKPHPIIFHYYD